MKYLSTSTWIPLENFFNDFFYCMRAGETKINFKLSFNADDIFCFLIRHKNQKTLQNFLASETAYSINL